MEAKEQSEGEKRVEAVLIAPLEALGLARPTTATLAKFEGQKNELRQKLAYMTEAGLIELREWVEAHPAGKDADRFPIPLKILQRAHKIETPETGPSPFILKVFATHHLVPEALAKGWAPELLRQVTAERGVWPGDWTCSKLRTAGIDHARRQADVGVHRVREVVGKGDGRLGGPVVPCLLLVFKLVRTIVQTRPRNRRPRWAP